MKKVLVYGYGNPGRQDDGLGVLLADMVDDWAMGKSLKTIETDSNYQLNIEDAYRLNDYDVIIYADASKEDINDYLFEEISPVLNPRFSMHSVSPEFVIGLCQEIYGEVPKTYLMHIKGYEWEFMEEVSKEANNNLSGAFSYLTKKIEEIVEV